MKNKTLEEEIVEEFRNTQFSEVWAEDSFNEIEQFLTTALTRAREDNICKKKIHNGKATCGVKLDCHLHDWRQKDMKLKWQKEAIKETKKYLNKKIWIFFSGVLMNGYIQGQKNTKLDESIINKAIEEFNNLFEEPLNRY